MYTFIYIFIYSFIHPFIQAETSSKHIILIERPCEKRPLVGQMRRGEGNIKINIMETGRGIEKLTELACD